MPPKKGGRQPGAKDKEQRQERGAASETQKEKRAKTMAGKAAAAKEMVKGVTPFNFAASRSGAPAPAAPTAPAAPAAAAAAAAVPAAPAAPAAPVHAPQAPAPPAPPRQDVHGIDIELDEDIADGDDADAKGEFYEYRKAVHKRFQHEVDNEGWLFEILRSHDFTIPASMAKDVCRKLGLEVTEQAYYCDIIIWDSLSRWGEHARPSCACCHLPDRVVRHGREIKQPGRRVIGLRRNSWIMAMRFKCGRCEEEHQRLKQSAEQAGAEVVSGSWSPRAGYGGVCCVQ